MVTDAAPAGGGIVVCGRAGVGKSALARRVAQAVASEFPDGQVYLDLAPAGVPGGAQQTPGSDIMAALLRCLGVAPEVVPHSAVERATLIRSLTAGYRPIVILDNASSSAQVQPLLTAAAGLTVLTTSRRRLGLTLDTRDVSLHPLTLEDAVVLMASQVGRARVDEDRTGATALARMCDGLPLALRIAGGRLTIHPDLSPSMLADMTEPNPLDGLELGDLSMRHHLAHDYRVVAGEDAVVRAVFPLLGRLVPEETLTVQEAAERLGEDRGRVFGALEHLVDAYLVEAPRPGHYRAPGLLRHFAAGLQLVTG